MVIDKNFAAAEILYKKAIEKYPQSPIPYKSLGDLYLQQERFEDAEKSFLEAVKIKPDHEYSWGQISSLRVRKGDFKGAKEAADRANEL